TADEAAPLAAFLESGADEPKDVSGPGDTALIERGKKLAQTSGCLNCHSLRIENQFKTKSLAELTPDKWKQGCLAGNWSDGSKAPQFNFTAAERDALQAFAPTDRASLTRHVPSEFAERQARLLRCAECHGRFEGFPPWETLGGKMKPEWMKAFIGGDERLHPFRLHFAAQSFPWRKALESAVTFRTPQQARLPFGEFRGNVTRERRAVCGGESL